LIWPAEIDEGRQLLAASRLARRRAGNHEREAARAWQSLPPANETAAQRRGGSAALSRYSCGDNAELPSRLADSESSKGDYSSSYSFTSDRTAT
jgi:hypothetical protein